MKDDERDGWRWYEQHTDTKTKTIYAHERPPQPRLYDAAGRPLRPAPPEVGFRRQEEAA